MTSWDTSLNENPDLVIKKMDEMLWRKQYEMEYFKISEHGKDKLMVLDCKGPVFNRISLEYGHGVSAEDLWAFLFKVARLITDRDPNTYCFKGNLGRPDREDLPCGFIYNNGLYTEPVYLENLKQNKK